MRAPGSNAPAIGERDAVARPSSAPLSACVSVSRSSLPELFKDQADRLAEAIVGLELLFDVARSILRRQDARHGTRPLRRADPLRVACDFVQYVAPVSDERLVHV